MKARIGKRTVDVYPDDGRYYDPSDQTYYDEDDLIFDDDIDWQSFRGEAAKDIMCHLVGMGRDDGYKYSPAECARYAIIYADELIKQLKQ